MVRLWRVNPQAQGQTTMTTSGGISKDSLDFFSEIVSGIGTKPIAVKKQTTPGLSHIQKHVSGFT
jgi:hypothetical protein